MPATTILMLAILAVFFLIIMPVLTVLFFMGANIKKEPVRPWDKEGRNAKD